LKSPHCHRVYLTDVMSEFECDTFFPEMRDDEFQLVDDPDVPKEVQEEQGIHFKYQVFERR
jgi:dihydrofolate reductase